MLLYAYVKLVFPVKRLIILLLFIVAGVLFYFWRSNANISIEPEPVVYPTNSEIVIPSPLADLVQYKGKGYAIASFKVSDFGGLKFVGNYEKRLSASSIVEDYGCKQAISGGFYGEDYRPIGLYIEDGTVRSDWKDNPTFNGVLWIGRNTFEAGVSRKLPDKEILYAIQSGPMLIENEVTLTLRINEDEEARRSVVISSDNGLLYFLSIYDPKSVYIGPFLSDLPSIIQIYGKEKNINIETAINLDGGSASFYHDGETTLSELVTVGGIICLQ
ncbi:phosphodiester glycosidase family protein [Candidatus Gottesmanbacteria bacterium]|nr:phosphodiester glycosidase family protein [Candidatus Gottesmanbacteria bacterium]